MFRPLPHLALLLRGRPGLEGFLLGLFLGRLFLRRFSLGLCLLLLGRFRFGDLALLPTPPNREEDEEEEGEEGEEDQEQQQQEQEQNDKLCCSRQPQLYNRLNQQSLLLPKHCGTSRYAAFDALALVGPTPVSTPQPPDSCAMVSRPGSPSSTYQATRKRERERLGKREREHCGRWLHAGGEGSK